MKIFIAVLFVLLNVCSCKQQNEQDKINASAVHFSGVFITENIHSTPELRLKGKTRVTAEDGNIFHVTGRVEGFSPMNYPVTVEHFKETLHYLGGDINKQTNWECIEIYVGDKKVK